MKTIKPTVQRQQRKMRVVCLTLPTSESVPDRRTDDRKESERQADGRANDREVIYMQHDKKQRRTDNLANKTNLKSKQHQEKKKPPPPPNPVSNKNHQQKARSPPTSQSK